MYQSSFKTKNVNIHYVQKYDGQDIVWCPGGDQTGEEWEEQFDFFKDFRNAYCPGSSQLYLSNRLKGCLMH